MFPVYQDPKMRMYCTLINLISHLSSFNWSKPRRGVPVDVLDYIMLPTSGIHRLLHSIFVLLGRLFDKSTQNCQPIFVLLGRLFYKSTQNCQPILGYYFPW